MALFVCRVCTTAYAPARACPHCGELYSEEGSMAKISRHGGPSNEALYGEAAGGAAPLPPAVGDEEREHPGTGVPGEGVQVPADGQMHELVVDEPAPASRYDGWLLPILRDECDRRGLSRTGPKSDLVARLVADDAAQALPVAAEAEAEPEA